MSASSLLVINSDSSLESKRSAYLALQSKLRFPFLFLICIIGFGRYYCVDLPPAHHKTFISQYGIDDFSYSALCAAYSIPNLVLPFIMGYFADKIGRPLGLVIFVSVVTVGQVLFAFSAHVNVSSFWLAFFARLIFGSLGKSVTAMQSAFISEWFKYHELTFSLSMNLCLMRISTALCFYLSPTLSEATGSLAFAFWFGTFMLGVALLGTAGTVLLDQFLEIRTDYVPLTAGGAKKINLGDVRNLSGKFWLIVCTLFLYYSSFLSFVNISVGYLVDMFGFESDKAAGPLASLIHTISAIGAPIIGILIDKFGRKTFICFGATALAAFMHFYLAFLPSKEDATTAAYASYILIGVSYAFFGSSSWPMIPFAVDKSMLATAYGIAFSFQSIGSVVTPLIVGLIADAHKTGQGKHQRVDYFWVSIFFGAGAVLGLLTNVMLILVDFRNGGVLSSKNSAQTQKMIEEKAKDADTATDNKN